jgi:hypothetical protein
LIIKEELKKKEINRFIYSGQEPEGMEQDCNESHGSQRIGEMEEEDEEQEEEMQGEMKEQKTKEKKKTRKKNQ